MGSNQKHKENNNGPLTADVDTSPPFASVMEAVSRFGGVGFWRPRSHNPAQPFQTNRRQVLDQLEAKTNTQSDDGNNEVRVGFSENEILKRIKEATEDVRHCTRVLKEVLSRVEAAKNGTYLESDGVVVSRPVMSIGQILRRKLVLAGERPEKSCMRWKVSLADIIGKGSGNGVKRGGVSGGCEKRIPVKRTKLGFGGGCGGGGEKGVPAKRMRLGFGGILFMAKKKTCEESR